jgi:hypothetical protein
MHADHSSLIGNSGEPVPTVEMGDLKSAWNIYQDIESRHPGKQVGVDISVIQHACSATADVRAVTYRCGMLQVLERLAADRLVPWKGNGRLDDGVFSVAARIPMNWIGVGIPQSGLPFDVGSFFDELRLESA